MYLINLPHNSSNCSLHMERRPRCTHWSAQPNTGCCLPPSLSQPLDFLAGPCTHEAASGPLYLLFPLLGVLFQQRPARLFLWPRSLLRCWLSPFLCLPSLTLCCTALRLGTLFREPRLYQLVSSPSTRGLCPSVAVCSQPCMQLALYTCCFDWPGDRHAAHAWHTLGAQ